MLRVGIAATVLIIITCFAIKTQSFHDYKTYRCKSGAYISDKFVCDGHDELCGQFKDDSIKCDLKKCGAGKFKCAGNNTCLNITARCNNIMDCTSGTDELDCGDETKVHDCHFHKGKFLCYDKLRCLDLDHTCDGSCNCFDCSDENSNCTNTENVANEKCRVHFPTPNGPQCFCDPTNKDNDELCEKVEDCSYEYHCSQRCSRFKSKIFCSCYENYNLDPTSKGSKCYSDVSIEDTLLYTTASKIKALKLTSSKTSILIHQVECASIAAALGYVYFTTYRDNRRIIRTYSYSNGSQTATIEWNSTITSIAVDYVTSNIYFTANQSLIVCSNDGRICRQIKCCDVDFVALAPKSGLIFYTRKTSRDGRRFIMKSDMDGANEIILVDSTFPDPKALVVDELMERVYWMDGDEHLIQTYSASFNVEIFKQHKTVPGNANEAHVSAFQKNIYLAERGNNRIRKISSGYESLIKFHQDINTSSIELLFFYNPLLQNIYRAKNPCKVTSCPTGLCLLRPNFSSNTTSTFTCL